jgi:SNF2 family DNA or RNA helicase
VIELNWSRCKTQPFPLTGHQKDGIRALVADRDPASGRVIPFVFALFDDPGTSKSRQIVDAACFLDEAGLLDTVVVVTPASVRIVWGSDMGEVALWAWRDCAIHEYHAKTPDIRWARGRLNWVVTNYEFIRDEARRAGLIRQLKGRTGWLVLDESSRVKSHKAESTKACKEVRSHCERATLLNGSPVSNSPLDLFAQMDILDPRILGVANFFHFRKRYARMGGFKMKQVVGYQNLEDLNRRIRPYILRRRLEDCVELPPHTFQLREVRLEPLTWKLYKSMRDDMVAWLDGQPSMAPQAVVKILRLGQLTSGYLGGLVPEDEGPEPSLFGRAASLAEPGTPEFLEAMLQGSSAPGAAKKKYDPPKEVGREKHDAFMEWFQDWLARGEDRLIVWGRFRPELDRLQASVEAAGVECVQVRGGQGKIEREEAVRKFTQGPQGRPMVLFGSPQAGGLGLTLIQACTAFYLSNDYNLLTREQSEGRVKRRGQRHSVTYVDLVATGPDGQKTIDHVIIKALRAKRNMAQMTTAEWRRALTEE